MCNRLCRALGWFLVALGIIGFFAPNLFGAHLNPPHNLIHLSTGVLALCFGFPAINQARVFCFLMGILYGFVGLAGFYAGSGTASFELSRSLDPHLLRLYPGVLEFGSVDHAIHLSVAALFLIASFSRGATVIQITDIPKTAAKKDEAAIK